MKKTVLLAAVLMMILHLDVNGITPVFVWGFDVDTSLYDKTSFLISYLPGPCMNLSYGFLKDNEGNMFVFAYRKKNSNQFDFYSYTGKVATSIVPMVNQMNDYLIDRIYFSRNMLDEDANWESIVWYYRSSDGHHAFKVFDDDGTELLSDTSANYGFYYGFDGDNTYVVDNANHPLKVWRFRTNIASFSHPLAKSQAMSPGLMTIYGQDNGNYRITLSPSSGNQVNFQMFDLLGRCVFSKQINNITSPQSFTIPESNVPNTPFIAKATDKNGSYYKKQIPVR